MLQNLLLYRFILLNSIIFVCFGAALHYGWIIAFIQNDQSYISLVIISVFILSIIYQFWRALTTSKKINALKYAIKNNVVQEKYKHISIYPVEKLLVLRDKDLQKIRWMGKVAAWLVVLGLIGTVIGFIIALSGVPEASLSGSEGVSGIQHSVALLVQGMYVALFTTLAGSIAGLIVELNASLIHTGLFNYWADLIEKLG